MSRKVFRLVVFVGCMVLFIAVGEGGAGYVGLPEDRLNEVILGYRPVYSASKGHSLVVDKDNFVKEITLSLRNPHVFDLKPRELDNGYTFLGFSESDSVIRVALDEKHAGFKHVIGTDIICYFELKEGDFSYEYVYDDGEGKNWVLRIEVGVRVESVLIYANISARGMRSYSLAKVYVLKLNVTRLR